MERKKTKVVTGEVRFNYPKVYEPVSFDESQEKKYEITLLIPKKDKASLPNITQAINNALENGKSGVFNGKIPSDYKNPLRDGDDKDQDEFHDHYYIKAKATAKGRAPRIVDLKGKDIDEDSGEIYSGVYGRVSLNFFPYARAGNKGVSCSFSSIQKTRDGECLDGSYEDIKSTFGISDEDYESGLDDFSPKKTGTLF